MSWCRWSSDSWRSDLYVYESERGIEIHVAARRLPPEWEDAIPPAPPTPVDDPSLDWMPWVKWTSEVGRMAGEWSDRLVPIGLPHDGGDYTASDEDEAREVLAWLAALGYHVPASALAP